MKFTIFGLTLSSSWGNGHATIWRGLCKSLVRRGHEITFFERNVPFYESNRDLTCMSGVNLHLYDAWEAVASYAEQALDSSDVAIVTSYCPDAIAAGDLANSSRSGVDVFYDLDAPVTLKQIESGNLLPYIGDNGLSEFDLVLSYTGGAALTALETDLGAQVVKTLYGCADPEVHRPVQPQQRFKSDLSYLGTYSEDRQEKLNTLFVEAARRESSKKFMIGGSLYPDHFPWTDNIWYMSHVAPPDHSGFYCSSLFTLNVTRLPMAEMGFCPSGRLFEAAACGIPILSDYWEGLETFFDPGRELLIVNNTEKVVQALNMSPQERERIARACRERVLSEHTADHRAEELEKMLREFP